jgi:septum formation protein
MTEVILASASPTRKALLAAAGVPVTSVAGAFDEQGAKAALRDQGRTAVEVALALAGGKADAVAAVHTTALVVGADQMLECDGRWFDKPADLAGARQQLAALRGRAHRLVTAVVAVGGGRHVWQYVDSATLTMRPFSDGFLDAYLGSVGDAALASVGAYQLEGPGAQLFDKVEGDHFSILGLPLLPLLSFLRSYGVVGT